MNLKALILGLLITITLTQNLFNTSPFYRAFLVPPINATVSNTNVIKMLAEQTYVIVGFNNGSLVALNLIGNTNIFFNTSNNFPIIQLDSFPTYLMGLDSGNNIYIWNTTGNGSLLFNTSLPFTIKNLAWRQVNNSLIVSANIGSQMNEFQYSAGNFTATGKIYTIPNSVFGTFSTAIYSGDGNYLVAAANTISGNLVVFFNTTSGGLINSTVFVPFAVISKFSVVNNNKDIVALDSAFNVYQGTTTSNPIVGQPIMTIPRTMAFTGCPSGFIVSGNSLASNINVYNEFGNSAQQLLVPTLLPIKSLDCSSNYLVSLDIGGSVTVTSYSSGSSTISSTLAGGIIALIVICAILIAVAIGVIVFFCMKVRKMGLQGGGMNTTMMSDKRQMY